MRGDGISDQYDNWSATRHKNSFHRYFAAEKETASGPVASARGPVAGLTDRALQALREARMQMRSWTGPWSQILPVGKPIGIEASDGLRAARVSAAGAGILGQLSPGQGHSQRDLCHQPRVATPSPAAIGIADECCGYSGIDELLPRGYGRHRRGQHASGLCSASAATPAARGVDP